MIGKFEINGIHIETDDKLKKYVTKSVAKLERFMPRHARKSAHVEVVLRESKGQSSKKYTAEFILYLPERTLTAKESTLNIFAAVDIVEAKLQNQIRKYKQLHADPAMYRRLITRFKRTSPEQA